MSPSRTQLGNSKLISGGAELSSDLDFFSETGGDSQAQFFFVLEPARYTLLWSRHSKSGFVDAVTTLLFKILHRKIGQKTPNMLIKWVTMDKK